MGGEEIRGGMRILRLQAQFELKHEWARALLRRERKSLTEWCLTGGLSSSLCINNYEYYKNSFLSTRT